MPEPLVPEVRPRGVFTEDGPSSFGSFAADVLGAPPTRDFAAERAALAPRREAKEAERQKAVGAVTQELERTTADLATDAAARAKEREGGRAERDVSTRKLTEQATPEFTARPFLAPGAGILNQLQSALVGVTAMATQIRGLSGSAIPAMAAMKGLAEGYAKGDRERIDNEWAAWKAANAKLTAAHKAAVEKYRDLVEDQTLSAADKQLLASVRLKGLEWVAGQRALEAQDIEAQLKEISAAEDRHQKHTEVIAKLNESMAKHNDTVARLDRAYDATQRQRAIVNARAERGLKLHEENSRAVRENEALEVGAQRTLDDAGELKRALELLESEGVLNTGPTVWDKARLAVAIQSKPGRTDVEDALNVVRRIGGPLIVRREITSGMTAGLLRLAPIARQEVGDLNALPKVFWDRVLSTAVTRATEDRDRARRHLQAIGRAGATSDRDDAERFEVIE